MKAFPHEFEALLSKTGQRILRGKHAACGVLSREQFFSATGLLDDRQVRSAAALMKRMFADVLMRNEKRAPAPDKATISNHDLLPKIARGWMVPTAGPGQAIALERATELGLVQMLQSPSYQRFCEALAGRRVEGPITLQVMCSERGDYSGPHTDHHPAEPRMVRGYVDVHLTFCDPGVQQQFIVYAQGGHLNVMSSVAANGTVTAYRLPLWHYTTPLQTRGQRARRWVTMGTFVFALDEEPTS